MQYLCPLCMKNGIKSRIRAYQVNLEEGVWICEMKECPWPFGYAEPRFFQRDALSCDWINDPPNPPKECLSLLTELSLYTPPMTPAEGESSKESIDAACAELPQLSVDDTLTRMYCKTKFAGSTSDSNDLQWLKMLKVENISTDDTCKVVKMEEESVHAHWLEPKLSNFHDTDSATLPSINKYCDNRITQDDGGLCINNIATCISEDLNTIDNACSSEQRSGQSYKYSKESKKDENEQMQLNDTASSLSNDINMLPSTTNSVGDADIMNKDFALEDTLIDYCIDEYIDDNWINSLLS